MNCATNIDEGLDIELCIDIRKSLDVDHHAHEAEKDLLYVKRLAAEKQQREFIKRMEKPGRICGINFMVIISNYRYLQLIMQNKKRISRIFVRKWTT